MGFTLKIANAPAGAVLWNANFAAESFDYDPIADSGWLGIDEVWNYPSDPRGSTSLRIWALDADNNVLFDVYNLGPVNDGKNYIYNCTSGILSEEEPQMGAYTEITEIVAPSSAAAGSTVNVEVKIKNRSSSSLHIYCVALPDKAFRFIDWQEAWVGPGLTESFYGSFIMGGGDVTINAFSYYETIYGTIALDDSKSKTVTLAALPSPEFRGFAVTEYIKG